jgi:hypothetical protein
VLNSLARSNGSSEAELNLILNEMVWRSRHATAFPCIILVYGLKTSFKADIMNLMLYITSLVNFCLRGRDRFFMA